MKRILLTVLFFATLLSFADAQPSNSPPEPKIILTPKPGPAPRLNGPRVYGCRPGHPFLYRIPCQGERPMKFSATGLPASLQLDSNTGIVTGAAPARGEYVVEFKAGNAHGKSVRAFKIISGDTLALTPPMGFNDWYAFYNRVTAAQMRRAADILISSGLADVGYQYVNVDDCWMGQRDAAGNLTGNTNFPDMKALADYIHARGLKAGLYTSPGPLTCAGYTGAFGHEAPDAKQFADWGFDFLKYDWCSYGHIASGGQATDQKTKTYGQTAPTLEGYQRPYREMGALLRQQSRDIVFNLCQYGMGNVWEWGAEVGGHSWRTSGDLGFSLNKLFDVALKNSEHRAWSRPGAWNDPDYIQIGNVGNARGMGEPQPCPLTPTEQYTFMSLWCLMAAPLFYSGDVNSLDEFTLNILCNPEVIDVDQDPLGQSAAVARLTPATFLMVKDLADGGKAVGLCNQGETAAQICAPWSVLGVQGKQIVRDLWRQKDLGVFENEFIAEVPRHGVVLVRVFAK
jgi:alpha-galactosidase